MTGDPLKEFTGRWVVVSGASSGFGRAVAAALAGQGAGLILIGRDPERLAQTAALAGGAAVQLLPMDLTDLEAIAPRLRAAARAVGRIYGLCHAAGTVETLPLAACSPEHLRRMLEVNLAAGIEIARTLCRRDVMEDAGGSLVFISSVYARAGVPGQIGYSAAKGAVNAAVRAMAMELARRGIRVNSLSPGLVRTPLTERAFARLSAAQAQAIVEAHPLGIGRPEDVARAALFLLHPENRWITGIDLAVDGGYTAR